MVDKELVFLSKNSVYGVIKKTNPFQKIEHNIVYANGTGLKYGDSAEIFGALGENEIVPFMESAISEGDYYKEHYNFVFGYQPADFENEEIKENEVRIHYAGVDNTISKKAFYDLCLLLCEAKEYSLDYKEEIRKELLRIKSKLQEKIKTA